MKNLESYDVQIMNTKEVKEINGGIVFCTAAIVIAGTFASFAVIGGLYYAYQNSKNSN